MPQGGGTGTPGILGRMLEWTLPENHDERPAHRDLWGLERHEVPHTAGAYVLLARPGQRFSYPWGRSPVFYIGQAANLHRRLARHLKFSKEAEVPPGRRERRELYWPRYEYAAKFGARYAIIPTRQGLGAKALEDRLLARFALRYGAFPVANGMGSWTRIEAIAKELM